MARTRKRAALVALIFLAVPQGCAPSTARSGTSRPSGMVAACEGQADFASARVPDGRTVLQAFDSVHRVPGRSPLGAGQQRQRELIDSVTNTQLFGVPITSPARLSLSSRASLARLLERTYPPELRSARIGGEVMLTLFIDAEGSVRRSRVVRTSGYPSLDSAAMTMAQQVRFDPAMAGECSLPFVMQIPIGYRTSM